MEMCFCSICVELFFDVFGHLSSLEKEDFCSKPRFVLFCGVFGGKRNNRTFGEIERSLYDVWSLVI